MMFVENGDRRLEQDQIAPPYRDDLFDSATSTTPVGSTQINRFKYLIYIAFFELARLYDCESLPKTPPGRAIYQPSTTEASSSGFPISIT